MASVGALRLKSLAARRAGFHGSRSRGSGPRIVDSLPTRQPTDDVFGNPAAVFTATAGVQRLLRLVVENPALATTFRVSRAQNAIGTIRTHAAP